MNFTTWGPLSPYPSNASLPSDDADDEQSGRWAVDSLSWKQKSAEEWRVGQRPQHSFQPYEAADDACEPPSCLAGLELLGDDNSVLSFTLPASNSSFAGYLVLQMYYMPLPESATAPQPAEVQWVGSDWLYATPVPCTTGWLIDGDCAPCPTGGYCPGGGRVWPLPGYWSYSEKALPVACALPRACPGALSTPQLSADGSRVTSVCSAGFTGSFCTACDAGYYSSSSRCLSCGLQEVEKLELSILVIIAAGLFFLMAICVAVLSANGLSMAVAAILLIQHFAVVGKLAGQQVPEDLTWLATFFSVLSMLNFDVTFVKPGCVVASVSFLTVYWITLCIIVLTSGLFSLASLLRVRLLRSRRSAGPVIPWRWRFKARFVHSHLILGSILYLRVTTMTLQALHCTDVQLEEGGAFVSVLLIDLTTRCYEGAHLLTAVALAWPLLLLFTLGFPLLSAALLYRHFSREAERTQLTSWRQEGAEEHSRSAGKRRRQLSLSAGFSGGKEADGVELTAVQRDELFGSAASSMLSRDCSSSSGFSTPVATSAPSSPQLFDHPALSRKGPSKRPLLTYRHGLRSAMSRVSPSPPALVDAVARFGSAASRPVSPSPQWTAAAREEMAADRVDCPSSIEQSRVAVPSQALQQSSEGSAAQLEQPLSKLQRMGSEELLTSSTRAALRALVKDERKQELLGYLFRQLRGEAYYFRVFFLATSFGFACVAVLPTDPTLRLFLTGLFFLIDAFIVTAATPFDSWWRNLLSACMSLVGVVQILALLALVQLGLSSGDGTVDLGHSTTGQKDSQDPSDALTGVSYEAAQLELILGLLCVGELIAVAAVHRRTLKVVALRAHAAARGWSRRQSEQLERLSDWMGERMLAARTRVVEVNARECRRDSVVGLPMEATEMAQLHARDSRLHSPTSAAAGADLRSIAERAHLGLDDAELWQQRRDSGEEGAKEAAASGATEESALSAAPSWADPRASSRHLFPSLHHTEAAADDGASGEGEEDDVWERSSSSAASTASPRRLRGQASFLSSIPQWPSLVMSPSNSFSNHQSSFVPDYFVVNAPAPRACCSEEGEKKAAGEGGDSTAAPLPARTAGAEHRVRGRQRQRRVHRTGASAGSGGRSITVDSTLPPTIRRA